ncbi:hsp90-like protein [Auricularia subglabra TFB-10046 SS5]|nr:hsp90-like protein [Auricularia subglabra TFB-10046 SS5]
MPLNYSKWDQLEVSDDSDIEGHPNVDHKSLVRWKQRDIHEKREARKQRIAQLTAEIACNDVILPRIDQALVDTERGGPEAFSALVERLKTSPSPDKPPSNAPNQPTYDALLEASLIKIYGDLKNKGVDKSDAKFADKLVQEIRDHIDEFKDHHEDIKKTLANEIAEQKKKITSDDIHEGFASKYVPPKPEPAPLVPPKKTKKESHTEIEVLNPKASSSSTPAAPAADAAAAADDNDSDTEEEEEDAESLPEMTPELKGYAKIKIHDYEASYEYIKKHRSVYVPGASDALLVEGFSAEQRGNSKYAKQCIHQSLTLQYCEKLGKDGVRVFFQRMMNADPRAEHVFRNDFEDTYAHVKKRAAIVRAEEEEIRAKGGKEQIQLVPQDPTQSITFNVPDGPPPADLRLEGEGVEDLDIEEVRKALQMRWEIFSGFPPELQKALQSGKLEKVNKVLGGLSIQDAESVVESLQIGGILSFADEGKIRDAMPGDAFPGEAQA